MEEKFRGGMKAIDKALVTGVMKIWIYQHMLLQRISWMMMIYEIPVSWIENLEVSANGYLRKWLGVNKKLSDVALYCKDSPCPLPITSISREFKKRKATALVQLQQSQDESVSANVPVLKTGRKWRVNEEVTAVKGWIKLAKISGRTQVGRCGIGYGKRQQKGGSEQYLERKEISDAVVKLEDEKLVVKAVQQKIQGQWTNWQNIMRRDMSWNSLLRGSPRMVAFGLGVTFDTLATPNNLKRWGYLAEGSCVLCGGKSCGVAHILSGCKVSLAGGRYRDRHNAVLKSIAHGIQQEVNEGRQRKVVVEKPKVSFVKEGVAPGKRKAGSRRTGVLLSAADWLLLVDLERQLRVPKHICDTALRPDMVLYSETGKVVVFIELTCPVEENLEVRHEEKLGRYEGLIPECKENGWEVVLFAVEVGARGYVAASLRSCLNRLGCKSKTIKEVCREASNAALRSSFWIWLGRESLGWKRTGCAVDCVSSSETVLDGSQSSSQISSSPTLSSQMSTGYSQATDDGLEENINRQVNEIRNQTRVREDAESPMSVVKLRSGRCGMRNMGNSCYLSAVLQCLSVVDKNCSYSRKDGRLLEEYGKLMKILDNPSNKCVTPSQLKRALGAVDSRFKNQEPQDAHELLMLLLDMLKGEDRTGCLKSTLVCKSCGVGSDTYDQFKCLSWEIPTVLNSVLLQDCQEQFFKEEEIPLDQEWCCSRCGLVSEARKTLMVAKCPEVLIVQLKRFKFTGGRVEKVEQEVGVGSMLTLGDSRYSLVGVVKHSGSRKSGHYVAEVKPDMQWYCCNDMSTELFMRESLVWCKQAYLLFFKLQTADWSQYSDTSVEEGPRHVTNESRNRGRNSTWSPPDDV